MPDIDKLIEAAKLRLAKILDEDLNLPNVEDTEVRRNARAGIFPHLDFTQSIAWASQVLGIKKLQFKEKIEDALDELKVELVRSIVEGEAREKNKYEVVFLKLKSELIPIKPEQVLNGRPQYGQTREVIDLQEGDIPISYQSYVSMFSCGSGSGPGAGGQQLVREVVVLRLIVEG